MRLPLTKVYRAFPELDRFSDEQCDRYVRYVRNTRSRSYKAAAIAGSAGVLMIAGVAAARVSAHAVKMFWKTLNSTPWAIGSAAVAVIPVAAAALLILKVRDVELISAIRRRIEHARCPACSYSLLGLRTVEGRVTCPECGLVAELSRYGLTELDLVAQRASEAVAISTGREDAP